MKAAHACRRTGTAAALLAATLATSAGAATPRLRVDDGRLLDAHGRQVVLRGINVGVKRPPYLAHGGVRTSFTVREAAQLRRWGWNTIRLLTSWEAIEPRPGRYDMAYVRRYRDMVRMAGRHGLYVLVDMHQDELARRYAGNGFPDWALVDDRIPFGTNAGHPANYFKPAVGRAFTNFYENARGMRTRFVKAFATLAGALRDEPMVLGYDLFNEPSCEFGVAPCTGPEVSVRPEAAGRWLQPLYAELIPALRRADPGRPLFYEDFFNTAWGHVPFGIGVPPNPRWRFRHTGLSFHVYCPHPLRASVPCATLEGQATARALANARRNRAFPLLTEFGAVDDLRPIRDIARIADERGLSWQFWALKTFDDPFPGFGPDSLDPDADGFSLIAKDGRVKRGKLALLARAYPERIAGRAPRWSFDPRTARLRLTWRPASRGTTVVAVPVGVHYPRGYRVQVRGAVVLSRPGAPRLRLRGTGRTARLTLLPR